MSSSAVTKGGPGAVSTSNSQGIQEEQEHSAKASANAGLNLNVVGAVSGLFSGKSEKKTEADGSSVENKQEQAHVKGAGAGNLNAVASADAEEKSRHTRQAIQQGSASAASS